jgi:hypothetical protein
VASLDDLLVQRNRDTLQAILLSALQSKGFPTTDWHDGSVPRTIMQMIATGLVDREELAKFITAGGFLELAAALVDANGNAVESWCETLAEQKFNVTRVGATFTRKNLTLTCASGAGPYTRAAGELEAISQVGNRYRNVASVTVPDGGSIVAEFKAESPGEVLDSIGTIDELVTPLPGVTVLDALAQFSAISSQWNGSGNITPSSASAIPSPYRTIKVTITRTGRIGVAQFTLEVFAAGSVATTTLILTAATYTTGDVTLTFTDGSGTTDSFVAGNSWIVAAPGQPTVANGAPAETLTALVQRCRDRWPALSLIPTESRYAAWVRECSATNYMGINRILPVPSTTTAGYIIVYVADRSGTISVENLSILQGYLQDRSSEIERSVATACAGVTINVSGSVWVKRGRTAEVKALAQAAWASYLAEVPIGGEMPNHLVRVSKLDQILENSGCYNSEALAINGAATDVDLRLESNEVPINSATGLDALSWYEVA